ncbi:MAG TPA: endo-1,4-beta-xylanase [Verrucomicrobiota bacterium]|nr:endo-1,4-beta-xylanase [Verrucomicrobiota bacterium]HNT14424.1 endo-1,4-beta-xylanase [Verrucomicrobiota bacterium]
MRLTRRNFLKTTAAATLSLAPGIRVANAAGAQRSDEEILSQCPARIEQHRKSAGQIRLRDPQGRPVVGVPIRLEQLRHDFRFGGNAFMWDHIGVPDLEAQYRRQFAAVFNFATLGFYWAAYEAKRGQPNYEYTDRVVAWCREQGITCKGHPLVWDHPAGSPGWLPETDAELEALSTARVREIIARYQGHIDVWDVVNEATHIPEGANQTRMARWAKRLGPVEYAAKHLRVARAAHPTATLLVNDYRNDAPYLKLLRDVQAASKSLFDVVGLQTHMHDRVWPLSIVWGVSDAYAELGRPLHFTETTILSGPRLGPGEHWGGTTAEGEAHQAEQTANFYTALFAHPAVEAITWWDFSDRGAWQRAPAGWLRHDMSPKPVYERLKALIRDQWWSKLEGRSDAAGVMSVRVFHGTHRITITTPDDRTITKEVQWRPGDKNQFDIELP